MFLFAMLLVGPLSIFKGCIIPWKGYGIISFKPLVYNSPFHICCDKGHPLSETFS